MYYMHLLFVNRKKECKMNKEQNTKEALPETKPVLAESAFSSALSTLLRVGASMLTTGISGDISEWDLPKNTSLKTKRKIVREAVKWNEANRLRAIELKNAYDVLSRHFR